MGERLTHLDDEGQARMVPVTDKPVTRRRAVAEAQLSVNAEVRDAVFGGSLPKGDAVAVARVAGMMAAKDTSRLIPLCHPIGLDSVEVLIEPTESGARVQVECEVEARTGVEMEAMTGAAIAAVTLYDMVKGLDRGAEVSSVRLLEKSGGRSGEWTR